MQTLALTVLLCLAMPGCSFVQIPVHSKTSKAVPCGAHHELKKPLSVWCPAGLVGLGRCRTSGMMAKKYTVQGSSQHPIEELEEKIGVNFNDKFVPIVIPLLIHPPDRTRLATPSHSSPFQKCVNANTRTNGRRPSAMMGSRSTI